MLLALKRQFGLNVYLETEVVENLNYYFQNAVSVPGFKEDCLEQYPFETTTSGVGQFLAPEFKVGAFIEIPIKVSNFLIWSNLELKHYDRRNSLNITCY